jgi:hypothetical protein
MSSSRIHSLFSGPGIVLLIGSLGLLIYARFQIYYLFASAYQFLLLMR